MKLNPKPLVQMSLKDFDFSLYPLFVFILICFVYVLRIQYIKYTETPLYLKKKFFKFVRKKIEYCVEGEYNQYLTNPHHNHLVFSKKNVLVVTVPSTTTSNNLLTLFERCVENAGAICEVNFRKNNLSVVFSSNTRRTFTVQQLIGQQSQRSFALIIR